MCIEAAKLRSKTFTWSVLVLLCIWISGCQGHIADEDQEFRMLFDGFQLLLVDDLPPTSPVRELDTAAMRNRYPAEHALVPGRVYSFRKIMKASNEALGKEILPERLAKIGARVTRAPESSEDFVYPYIGGPLFVVEFEKDGHQGTIFNRVHTSSDPGEHWEELVVAYK